MKIIGAILHNLHDPTATLHPRKAVQNGVYVGCRENVGFLGLTLRKNFIYAITPDFLTHPTSISFFAVQD